MFATGEHTALSHPCKSDKLFVMVQGESNLKIRRPVDIKGDMPKNAVEAKNLLGVLSCETPNPDLHNFVGNFTYRPSSGKSPCTCLVCSRREVL